MGSLMSERIKGLRSYGVLIVLAALILVYSSALPPVIAKISWNPMIVKVILAFIIVLPVGLLMGIPFPLGMSVLGRTEPSLIPWAWAVNGCFSVLAPILAVMLALSLGYQFVLFAGAIAYLLAFLLIREGWKAAGK
jgi:hypothetical protein